jgi:signal transduction histidine kinase
MWRAWSLRNKLLGLILIVLIGVGSAMVALVILAAERERRGEAARAARALSRTIDGTLRSAMLSGDREILGAAVGALAEQAEVVGVAVLDDTGSRVIGAGVGLGEDGALVSLLARAQSTDETAAAQVGETGHAVVSPVHSDAACARCHGSKPRLGYIYAVVSTAREEHWIRAMRNRLLWGGLLLLAMTCLTIYLAVSRWVERPVARLTRLVETMRGGSGPQQDAVGAGDEIARLTASFNAMVAAIGEKTEALLWTERQLAQSKRLATIGLLGAGIAHEIASPLSTILLQAGFWEQHTDGSARAAAAAVASAANRVAQLQRELLTFDRREVLHLQPCDVQLVVKGCLALLSIPEVHCRFDAPAEPLVIMADQALLVRALGNIVHNAVQAMQGRGTLAVQVRAVRPNWAEVVIEDSGPGISPDDMPHIFEPFFTRKEEGRGTGLGLAIAREIVVRHGGEISAETMPAGARFRIRLPLSPPMEASNGADPDRR